MVEKILLGHDSKTVGYSPTEISESEDLCKYFYSCRYNKFLELCAGGNYAKCLGHNNRKILEKKFGDV